MSPIRFPTVKTPAAHARSPLQRACQRLQAGEAAKAEALLRALVARQPRHADGWHWLGVAQARCGRPHDAVASLRQAWGLRRNGETLIELALALVSLGNEAEAIDAYREALAIGIRHPRLHNNLGNLLSRQDERQQAIVHYRLAIELDPGYALAHTNLAVVLADSGQRTAALAEFEAALQLDGTSREAWLGYAGLLERDEQLAEADSAYRRAGRTDLARHARRKLAHWDGLQALDVAIARDVQSADAPAMSPWSLMSVPALCAIDLCRAARRFARSRWARELGLPPLVARDERDARDAPVVPGSPEKLRIGYLSCDFKDHATLHLLADVLEHHDPRQVEVHLYSYTPDVEDTYTRRIAAMPLTRHAIGTLSDAAAAETIARDGIQILVDLKGYTTGARPGITARRPAPVIVNWLGYPGSLGEPRLADFMIGDAIVTPPAQYAAYSETLALMPHCYQPNDAFVELAAPPSRAEAGLPEHGFVFCRFNQTFKFDPSTFDAWCTLLRTVASSTLWLAAPSHPQARRHLRAFAQARGVSPGRLIFAERLPREAHLVRLQLADLALDTFPVGSHTTGSDALRAGVPMITQCGDTFASRVGASLLHTVGLDTLVSTSLPGYLETARALATDGARQAEVRARLDHARRHGPLFDPARFTRDLERLYDAIWSRRGDGTTARERPVVIDAALP